DLIERLLLLVVATDAHRSRATSSDGVELIDENDRRRKLPRLLEEVAHPRRADADDGFHELACRDGDERHPGLTRHRAGQQRLAGPRWADEQHTLRYRAAQPLILLRLTKKVDDLDELLFRVIDSGDIGKRGGGSLGVNHSCPAAAETHDARAARGARRVAAEQDESADEQDRGANAEKDRE